MLAQLSGSNAIITFECVLLKEAIGLIRRKNTVNLNQNNMGKHIECPKFNEAVDLFLKEQKILNRTPRTLKWHQENFNALLKAFQRQNIPVAIPNITSDHLKHNFILYSLEQKNNKPTTVNNRMKTYRSFWAFFQFLFSSLAAAYRET